MIGISTLTEHPYSCEDCPCVNIKDYHCFCQANEFKYIDEENIPVWCPLKKIEDKPNWKFINIEGSDVSIIPFKEMLVKFRDGKIAVGYIDKKGQWYVNVGEGCSAQLFMDLYPIAVKELM